MKHAFPWYRAGRGWYVELNGKQHPLGKHPTNLPPPEKDADGNWRPPEPVRAAWHKLMGSDPANLPADTDLTVADVCNLFLAFVCPYATAPKKPPKKTDECPLKPNPPCEVKTYWWYRKYVESFRQRHGRLPALKVIPAHVTAWLDGNPKWKNSRRCAVICIKRAYNWAESEGILNSNPMKKVKKPPPVRRERIVTPEEWGQLVAAVKDQAFKDFLFALRETGCRPGEVRKVTAAQVNLELGVWIIAHHKTRKKTDKPRVVYLTPGMIELCKRLCAKWPTGPIFRGPRGAKPFSRNGVRCRFRRLREKLPHLKGVISYTVRHSYVTDALERGVPVATLAELVGHQDLAMIQSHYAHLSEKRHHLQEAARKAAGYCPSSPPPDTPQ